MTAHGRSVVEAWEDQLRARALRRLLTLARKHGLPMPSRIEFDQFPFNGRTVRSQWIWLDDDTDLTGWVDVLGLRRERDVEVVGSAEVWTLRHAEVWAVQDTSALWRLITVSVRCNPRPVTAVTA